MFLFFYSLVFLFGTCLGSFYVTTAERILEYYYGKKRKIGTPVSRFYSLLTVPSHCPNCETKVGALPLIPIFGYFFCRGKCTVCELKLPWIYPLSEFLFGLTSLLSFLATDSLLFSISITFLLGHLLISIYTDSTYYSLDYENIPFVLLFGSLANYALLGELPGLPDLFVFIGFLIFYLFLFKLAKGGMGMGDVIFAPCFAFLAGHPFWILFLNSSYTLALLVTILSRKKGESLRGKMIPMGVYFALALFFTYLAKVLYYEFGFGGAFGYEPET